MSDIGRWLRARRPSRLSSVLGSPHLVPTLLVGLTLIASLEAVYIITTVWLRSAAAPASPTVQLPRATDIHENAPVVSLAGASQAAGTTPPKSGRTRAKPASEGWLTIAAPFDVDIFKNGTLIGTSRSRRIKVASGSHSLELVNEMLDYRHTERVRIEGGKVVRLKLDIPQSRMHVNAVPWAEVWLDGHLVGETPIGNLAVAVGSHDVTFRHPELGERTITTIVKAGADTRVTTDLRR